MAIQTIPDFFNDYKRFSLYDCERSIPSIVDGLKPSQRKCVYGMSLRPNVEVKVAQLATSVAEKTDYHHGEGSLEGTIVGLAQTFPGSNNLNLFEPNGQFGNRLTHEAAAGRYIFTKFTDTFRQIFKKDDDHILDHLDSDGMQIEPRYYYPILPMCIINGAEGVGTGYACKIFSYNPDEVKKNILLLLDKKKMKELTPWFKGFGGTVHRVENQTIITGVLEVVNTTTIRITELPISIEHDKMKEYLNELVDGGYIKGYDSNSDEDHFEFTIRCPRSTTELSHDKLLSLFSLIQRDTENLTMWDKDGFIKKYESINHIISEFVEFRLHNYERRRLKLLEIENDHLKWLKEKLRFINYYLANHEKFAKKGKAELFQMLEKEKFDQIDRLLNERIYSLTKDEIERLKKLIKDSEEFVAYLKGTNAVEMYKKELSELSFK